MGRQADDAQMIGRTRGRAEKWAAARREQGAPAAASWQWSKETTGGARSLGLRRGGWSGRRQRVCGAPTGTDRPSGRPVRASIRVARTWETLPPSPVGHHPKSAAIVTKCCCYHTPGASAFLQVHKGLCLCPPCAPPWGGPSAEATPSERVSRSSMSPSHRFSISIMKYSPGAQVAGTVTFRT